jgi:hypothetical protein
MLKRLILLFAVLLLPCVAQAQFVTMTGNVLDPLGNVYQNGTYSINFHDPGTNGKSPTLAGGQGFPKSFSGSLDSFGFFTVPVADNSVIAAASGETGTFWTFNFCGNPGILKLTVTNSPMPCFTYTTPIVCSTNTPTTCSTNTMNISAQLQGVAALLPITGTGSTIQPAIAGDCVNILNTAGQTADLGQPCLTVANGTLATDSFTRANQNPITAPWVSTGITGFVLGQVLNNQYVGQTASSTNMIYNGGITWPNNQFSQGTLVTLNNGKGYAGLEVRGNVSVDGGITSVGYLFLIDGVYGGTAGMGVLSPMRIYNTTTAIFNGNVLAHTGDVFLMTVIGTQISVYQNGKLIPSWIRQ